MTQLGERLFPPLQFWKKKRVNNLVGGGGVKTRIVTGGASHQLRTTYGTVENSRVAHATF